jgi:hypothetical protein
MINVSLSGTPHTIKYTTGQYSAFHFYCPAGSNASIVVKRGNYEEYERAADVETITVGANSSHLAEYIGFMPRYIFLQFTGTGQVQMEIENK